MGLSAGVGERNGSNRHHGVRSWICGADPDQPGQKCGATRVVEVAGEKRRDIGEAGGCCTREWLVRKNANRCFDKSALQYGNHVGHEIARSPHHVRRHRACGPVRSSIADIAILVYRREMRSHRRRHWRPLPACCIVGPSRGLGHRFACPVPRQAESRESGRNSKLRRTVIRRMNPFAGQHGRWSPQTFACLSIGRHPANESAERDQRITRTLSPLTRIGHLEQCILQPAHGRLHIRRGYSAARMTARVVQPAADLKIRNQVRARAGRRLEPSEWSSTIRIARPFQEGVAFKFR